MKGLFFFFFPELLFNYLSKSREAFILPRSPLLVQFQCTIQQGLTYIVVYACLGNMTQVIFLIYKILHE